MAGFTLMHVANDSSFPNQPIQLEGQLLLADPSLRCSLFTKSVVLLAHHDAKSGAFGLILNQPTGKTVGEFLPGEFFEPLRKISVYQGGPVDEDQLTFCSFWWTTKGALRWALRLSMEEAAAQAQRPGRIVKGFIGYSGWTAGQLEDEMRRSSWLAVKPRASLLSHSHDRSLWARLVKTISPYHHILAQVSDDPSAN